MAASGRLDLNTSRRRIALRTGQYILPCTGFLFVTTPLFLLGSNASLGPYDEGVILTGAFRVLHGDIPSKDFYVTYGPGQFYVVAALFKIFGINALVARVYDSVLLGAIVAAVFIFVRRLHTTSYAGCCALVVAATLFRFRQPLYPVTPTLLVAFAAAAHLIQLLATNARKRAYLPVSVALALLVVFRYDVAVSAAAALALPIATVHCLQTYAAGSHGAPCVRDSFKVLLVVAAAPVVVLLWLLSAGVLLPALDDILRYNGANYIQMRSLPFPELSQVWQAPLDVTAVYFPIAATLLAALTLIANNRSRQEGGVHSDHRMIAILVFSSMTFVFFVKGWVRVSGTHMLLANVPAVTLGGCPNGC